MTEKVKYTATMRKMINEENKKAEGLKAIKRYCEHCGHTNYVPKRLKKIICSYCGHAVYYDEKEKFKDKLGRMVNKC